MTVIKLKFKLTPSGDIDFNDNNMPGYFDLCSSHVRDSGEGADSVLRVALFRLSGDSFGRESHCHRASAVLQLPGGAYVPPTATEYDAWMVNLGTTVSDAPPRLLYASLPQRSL